MSSPSTFSSFCFVTTNGHVPAGQLFFDQSLITTVNTDVSPYNTSTIAIVDNVDDRVFVGETDLNSDPVMDYVLLGDDVTDGESSFLGCPSSVWKLTSTPRYLHVDHNGNRPCGILLCFGGGGMVR